MPRRSKSDELPEAGTGPSARPQEQLLIDTIGELSAGEVICNSSGRAQFAVAYAQAYPEARVQCAFFDLYQRERAEQMHEGQIPPNLTLLVEPDLPDVEADLVVIVCRKTGESEFTRDLLQQAHNRLKIGGRLVASIDFADDRWLHEELRKVYPKVTRRSYKKQGAVYLATKTEPLKKQKTYDAEFAFRDEGRLIFAMSRPGVFSHRRLDVGARALLEWAKIQPGQHVLDLGCGSGAVGIAAALRAENVIVQAVDSNPRAVQCTQWGAERNGVADRVTAVLNADGQVIAKDWFDVVLANPPYFSNYRIAQLFLASSYRCLKRHGWVHIVTKTPVWFEEIMPEVFEEIEANEVRDYWIVSGRKPNFHLPKPVYQDESDEFEDGDFGDEDDFDEENF